MEIKFSWQLFGIVCCGTDLRCVPWLIRAAVGTLPF